MLMVAQVVHVTPQDRTKIETYAEEIRLAGFDIEPFGDDAYQIRAVPNVLGVPQSRAAFLEMVDRLGEPFYARSLDMLEGALQKVGKRLLYSCIVAVTQKIYLEKSLEAIASEMKE